MKQRCKTEVIITIFLIFTRIGQFSTAELQFQVFQWSMTMTTNPNGQRFKRTFTISLYPFRSLPMIEHLVNDCIWIAYHIVNGRLLIQMQSEYLNEDKICELFQSEQDSGPRREEVSLNFTVTSRDSRSAAQTGWDFNHGIDLALSELSKFNGWVTTFNSKNQKLLDELQGITTEVELQKPMMLTAPDFSYLRRKCKSNPQAQIGKPCSQCSHKTQLLQIIKEQYDIKIQDCQEITEQLEKVKHISEQEFQKNLRDFLITQVEKNTLEYENQQLKTEIQNLKNIIEKEKLEKSLILQKSSSLLRTKDLLEKKLESGHNMKSFSNAKNSTNPTNPNDTLNRVDSIICFSDSQPNLDELIKFYSEEFQHFKGKCLQIINDEQKRMGKKFLPEDKNSFINKFAQKKFYTTYKTIVSNFNELKMLKQQHSQMFHSIRGKKFESLDATTVNSQQFQEMKKMLACFERDIMYLQTTKNNLEETNGDLRQQVEELTSRIRIITDELNARNRQFESFELNNSKNLAELQKYQIEYKSLQHKYRQQIIERKKLIYEIEDMKGSIRVYCRIRPRLGPQLKQRPSLICQSDSKVLKDGKQYEFDHIFNEKSTQNSIFSETKGLVEYAYDGKNLCVFAYGQTGSGKTYTIHGTEQNPGLAHNIIGELFSLAERDKKISETSVSMNIVEIYKENIRDLLGISDKIEIKEDYSRGGVYLEDCRPVRVKNYEQMMDLYTSGMERRVKCQTDMNADSSRSHCILIINIERTSRKNKEQKFSKITLIDLAGAEKLSSSNPLIAKETQFINKSLSSLVTVLTALKCKKQHVPYRDSKLTYLLKDSLSSKCNILTFINVASNQSNSVETTNTLNFGMRARAIERSYLKQKQKEKEKQNQQNRRSSSRLSIG